MKRYKNGMSSTCFTRKQVGFVYRAAREGRVKIPSWVISAMYDLADFYGYANKNIAEAEEIADIAIRECINGEWEWAQAHIDEFAEAFLATGLKRTSRNVTFVHDKNVPWGSEIPEDLKEN